MGRELSQEASSREAPRRRAGGGDPPVRGDPPWTRPSDLLGGDRPYSACDEYGKWVRSSTLNWGAYGSPLLADSKRADASVWISVPPVGDAPITCQPLFGGSGVKTADRILMSHSRRGQALIGSRVFEMVARTEGRRIAGKSAQKDDRTGKGQTHSPGI